MRRLLLTTTTLLLLATPSFANTIADFGLDPTSATGTIQHSPTVGLFDDQYTFHLDHMATLTIASITNVFAQPSDFISGFSGEVIAGTPSTPGPVVIGPVAATPCILVPACQGFAGSALLGPGAYFLDIKGTAGTTAGYGGDLATFAVPGPIVGASIPGLIAACFGMLGFGWKRRKRLNIA